MACVHVPGRGWRYDANPALREQHVPPAAARVQAGLNSKKACHAAALDTRPAHQEMFKNLNPPWCPHFSGKYRGTPCCDAVRLYEVVVRNAYVGTNAGFSSQTVHSAMVQVNAEIQLSIDTLDAEFANGEVRKNPEAGRNFLGNLIELAAMHFWAILKVHPFADGNGHAARVFLWAFLSRYGYPPKEFTIEPRPADFDLLDIPHVSLFNKIVQEGGMLPYTLSLRVYAVESCFLERLILHSLG